MNEEVDPAAIIRRLKQEVRDLKDELQLLRGGAAQRGPLTPDELLRLRQQLLAYVGDSSAGASLNLGGDMMMIRASESGDLNICNGSMHGMQRCVEWKRRMQCVAWLQHAFVAADNPTPTASSVMLQQCVTCNTCKSFLLIAGWQVFKQLLLEGKHGVAANAVEPAAPAGSSNANSSGSSSKAADTSTNSGASSVKALQEQVRKLQLQVSSCSFL